MLNEDSLERELSCGICFELYNEPLQLPCMHTFCKDCVKDIIANSRSKRLKCPDCRRNADLGKTGIDSLKRNFKLASIVDVYRVAIEKLSVKEQEPEPSSAQPDGGHADGHNNEDKDYEFLSSVIQRSHADASDPFEPHIIDDLWGTFKRTARRGSYMTDRPPAPPPPRSQTNARSSAAFSSRPLPPIPPPNPSPPPIQRRSHDLTQHIRPLPPDPSTRMSPSQASPGVSPSIRPTPGHPLHSLSNEDLRAEPTAPPYFTLSEAHSGHNASLPVDVDDEDEMFDMSSLNAPPLPPRSSHPPSANMSRSSHPPSANTSTRTMSKRPPIPVPRGKVKKKAPPPPRMNSEGTVQDGRRPPPPVPRSKHSS